MATFSKRYRDAIIGEVSFSAREDAPHEFRGVLANLAYETGVKPSALRELVCRLLSPRPDSNNWPDISSE